jgi:pantothenate kinase type III
VLFVADIGNTSTTIGIYDGEILVHNWRIASDDKRLKMNTVLFCIISLSLQSCKARLKLQ